jgi:protein TonB
MKRLTSLIVAIMAFIGAKAADKPQFPGGEEALNAFITSNMVYPVSAMNNGIEGNVTLEFIVKSDGSISAIKVKRMIDPDLEEEAIRVVKSMPAWVPAELNGSPVESKATVVIPFRLEQK